MYGYGKGNVQDTVVTEGLFWIENNVHTWVPTMHYQ